MFTFDSTPPDFRTHGEMTEDIMQALGALGLGEACSADRLMDRIHARRDQGTFVEALNGLVDVGKVRRAKLEGTNVAWYALPAGCI
jgi:hypothetical protein